MATRAAAASTSRARRTAMLPLYSRARHPRPRHPFHLLHPLRSHHHAVIDVADDFYQLAKWVFDRGHKPSRQPDVNGDLRFNIS